MPRFPDLPCADCGQMMWRSATSRPEGLARCRPCRRASPQSLRSRRRPPVTEYACHGCAVVVTRPPTKGQRPKWCEACRKLGSSWIPMPTRRTIYARDDWTCQICLEDVDADLVGTRSAWRPSIDHILPRSKGGSDEPSNLRLAHLWCNSVRSDERAYTEEDLRHGRAAA